MKRALRYLKFIGLGVVSTLVMIFLINQVPTTRDAAVDEVINAYQPVLEKNELVQNPLFLFLQQHEPTSKNMAEYAQLISTSEFPVIPPRLEVHKSIISLLQWNKELIKYAETQSEAEKIKILASIVKLSAKLLENKITILEFRISLYTTRLALDWAAGQKWSQTAKSQLKSLNQVAAELVAKREALVRNSFDAERDLSFEIIRTADFSRLEIINLDPKTGHPEPPPDLKTKIVMKYGPLFFNRNQTLNIISERFIEMKSAVGCLQDYSCEKQKFHLAEESTITEIRNPVGKGILKLLAMRDYEMARNQEAFQKLEQSNQSFSTVL